MSSIKVTLGDYAMGLDDLNKYFYYYGVERIGEFYKENGFGWFYSHLPGDIENFNGLIRQLKEQKLPEDEDNRLFGDLRSFVVYLGRIKRILDAKVERGRSYDGMKLISGFVSRLEGLVDGFSGAEGSMGLRDWLIEISRRPYVRRESGISYPIGFIRE